jgi:hypothetical protein
MNDMVCEMCIFYNADDEHEGCLFNKTPVQHSTEDRLVCKYFVPDNRRMVKQMLRMGLKYDIVDDEVVICGIRFKTPEEMVHN